MTTRARDGLPEVRRVGPAERVRLRASFGSVLALERGYRHVDDVAAAAEMNPVTVRRLEAGHRRPTTSSVWRLARALRPAATLRERVALDQRLREAAGESLVYARTRPHRRREAVRAELLAEAREAGGPVAANGDSLGAVLAAEVDRCWAEGPDDCDDAGGRAG